MPLGSSSIAALVFCDVMLPVKAAVVEVGGGIPEASMSFVEGWACF